MSKILSGIAQGAGLVLLLLVVGVFATVPPQARGTSITGYAWSDTIGWVSLSGSGYGLTLQGDNTVTGYAWSDSIGWIQFGGLSSFPVGSGTQGVNAKIENGALVGWAKATSAADGWDGWIALSGTNFGPVYSSGVLSGYAWGSEVVGWLSFSASVTPPCQATQGNFCYDTNHSQYRDPWCTVTPAAPGTSCSLGCSGTTGACIAPTGCLVVGAAGSSLSCSSPSSVSVRKGNAAQVYWSVSNVTNCTLTASNGQNWSGTSGNAQTSALSTRTNVTLSCDSGAFTRTAVVNMLPGVIEI